MPSASPPEEKLYLFKPPPPYPGTSGNGSVTTTSPTNNADMKTSSTITSSESQTKTASKEQSQSSIKMGTSVSRVPPTDMQLGGSSRSVSSAVSVVSAEVHKIPNGKDNQASAENKPVLSSGTGIKSPHAPVPKTNGLLKEGNGRKAGVIHNENKVGIEKEMKIILSKFTL